MYTHGIESLKNLLKHTEIDPLLLIFLPNMSYDCSQITGDAVLHDVVQFKTKEERFGRLKILILINSISFQVH